jgi:hypothetical protein
LTVTIVAIGIGAGTARVRNCLICRDELVPARLAGHFVPRRCCSSRVGRGGLDDAKLPLAACARPHGYSRRPIRRRRGQDGRDPQAMRNRRVGTSKLRHIRRSARSASRCASRGGHFVTSARHCALVTWCGLQGFGSFVAEDVRGVQVKLVAAVALGHQGRHLLTTRTDAVDPLGSGRTAAGLGVSARVGVPLKRRCVIRWTTIVFRGPIDSISMSSMEHE